MVVFLLQLSTNKKQIVRNQLTNPLKIQPNYADISELLLMLLDKKLFYFRALKCISGAVTVNEPVYRSRTTTKTAWFDSTWLPLKCVSFIALYNLK